MGQNECTCDTQGESIFDDAPLQRVLDAHGRDRSALIPVLQSTQDAYGYVPQQALSRIARALRTPLSEVFGVATFYAQFHLQPRGERLVRICHGTACHVGGANDVTRAIEDELGVSIGETATDLSFTVESVACVGCCSLAPVVLVDDRTFGRLDSQSARKLASRFRRERAS